jgi:hypothetical protein
VNQKVIIFLILDRVKNKLKIKIIREKIKKEKINKM